MKNQLIHLKHFLTGIGFFSLFLICIGDEVRADSINNAEKKDGGEGAIIVKLKNL